MLDTQKILVTLFLAFLLVLAGCGDGQPEETPSVRHADVIEGDIDLTADKSSWQGPPYFERGEVEFEFYGREQTFHDVMLCVHRNETVLQAINLGDLTAPDDSTEYEIRVDRLPDFITVYHPDFRDYDLSVGIRERKAAGLVMSYARVSNLQDELPYSADIPAGECQ